MIAILVRSCRYGVVFVPQKCQRYRSLEFRFSQGCEKPVVNSVFWLSGRKKVQCVGNSYRAEKTGGVCDDIPRYNGRILESDYEICSCMFNHFHMIWSSPPCTEYSIRSSKDCRNKSNIVIRCNPENNCSCPSKF